MKRIVWLAMVIALLVGLCASAQGDMLTYTNETDGYKIDYPADWSLISRETIDLVLEKAAAGEISGLDGSALSAYKEQMKEIDLMLCMAPDNSINFNISYTDIGVEATTQQIVEQLCPGQLAEFEGSYADFEALVPGDIITSGAVEYAYLVFTCNAGGGNKMISQMYYPSGTKLYIITYTISLDVAGDRVEEIDSACAVIAASFKPGA